MNSKFKKPMAAVLAGALVFTMMPELGPETAKAAELPEVTAHYDMSHSGEALLDVSGNGRNAKLYSTEDSDFKSSGDTNILQFTKRQYAELPQGLVTGDDNDFTVEITLSTTTGAAQWAWCIGQGIGTWAGNDVGNYVFVNPKGAPGDRGGEILAGIKVGSPQTDEVRLPSPSKNLGADYATITMVGEDNTLTLYLDGEEVASVEHSYSMSDVVPKGNVLGYIGKSLWEPDALLTANVGDIKFYDEALTEDQVKESMPTDAEKDAMYAAETGTEVPGGDSGSELIASYDMSHTGNVLKDVSGNGNDAALSGAEDTDFRSNGEGKVWQLDGESYAALPFSIAEDLGDSEDFTIQATLTTQKSAAHWLFAIGDGMGTWGEKNVGDYIFVNPSASEKSGNFLAAIKTGTGSNWKETRFSDSSTGMGDVNGYGTVTLTGEGGNLKLYLDGQLISTASQDKTIQDVIPTGEDAVFGYIGKSLYEPDALLTANLADFKIYSGALTETEIKEGLPTADEKSDMLMADILETVKGENASLDAVTEDLNLADSIDNVKITWGSWDETDVIAEDGAVTAPAEGQVDVTIPFSYEIDGASYENEISVTVLPIDTDAELQEAVASLDIPNKDDVRGNITLPETSENGISIKWSTDHDEIVNVNLIPGEDGYDDTPAGTVTRPEKDTVVTMTATLTLNDKTVSKDIEINVKAAPEPIEESDYTDYFFAYFAGEGYSDGEQIYFASSQDGLNWDDLNNNKPVLTSTLGEKGVRDPFIIRSPEGDKFYLIATDLKINGGNGWDAAQNNGSQSLMVWESTDLVNWSDQRMVEVSAEIGAGCTWAPEATYDPTTGEYVVYWASRTPAVDQKQRLYYAKTRDFYTFTEPQVFIDTEQSSIDTTIIYEDGVYYRYTKNEGGSTNEFGAPSKTIYAQKSDRLLGGEWENITTASLNREAHVEGPTIFKLNEDDQTDTQKYCLLVDNFGGIGYYPLVTDDLSDGEFSRPDTTYKMPTRARHGTPIRVTSEEYQAIMAAYSSPEEVNTVTYEGETPDLPDTVTFKAGEKVTEKAVTWNLEGVSFEGDPFSTVTVTGTVEGSTMEATANVRIIPKNIEYMIDCNNPESATWAGAKELNSGLLNGEAADQAKTEDNTWGYTSTVGSSDPADITGYSQNDINNPYAGGWWARGGKDITYQVTLPAGEHTVMLGCTGWWSMGRQMDVFYSVNGAEETKLCDLDAVNSQARYASGTITLDEESVVTLTVKKADNNAPILSWIAVSGTAAEEPEPEIDTTALQSAVDSAKALDAGVYTEGSYADVKEALDAAEAMLADPTSQEEVNAAAAALQSAVENLVSIAELREYCAGHADYTEDAYTAESYAAYAEAFEAAQAVLGKADASQDEVDAALAALTEAVNGLEEKPDVEVSKDALQNLYDQYKDTEQGSYTDESYAAFTEALENAAAVLADENATQADVDHAFNALNSAAEALTEKTENPDDQNPDKPNPDDPSGGDVTPGGDDGQTGDNGNGANGNNNSGSNTKDPAQGGSGSVNAPKTGDNTNPVIPAAAAVLALAAAVIVIERKRRA